MRHEIEHVAVDPVLDDDLVVGDAQDVRAVEGDSRPDRRAGSGNAAAVVPGGRDRCGRPDYWSSVVGTVNILGDPIPRRSIADTDEFMSCERSITA